MADINIGGTLHSVATGNVVARADEIKDTTKDKKQDVINAEVDEALTEHAGLIAQLQQQYATINRNEVIVGSKPDTGETGKIYRVPNDGGTTYTDYMWYGGDWIPMATFAITNEPLFVGLYTCDTDADDSDKIISVSNFSLPTFGGGSIKIKMVNHTTANSNYLKIGNTGRKPLYYGDSRASRNNSWKAGDVLEVYYDPTQNAYYANTITRGTKAVEYVDQTLTSEQKKQACTNIGAANAASVADISVLVAQFMQKSLIVDSSLEPESSFSGCYVKADGTLAPWSSATTLLYPVTPGTLINVHSVKSDSLAACKYGFYSSSAPSAETVVSVAGTYPDDAYNDIVVVPSGAAYIAVTAKGNVENTGVSNVVGLADNGIITLDKLAHSIFDNLPAENSARLLTSGAVYQAIDDLDLSQAIYDTVSPTSVEDGIWIAGGGEIRTLSSYKMAVFNVSPGDKMEILRTQKGSASARIYAIYSTRDSSQWGTSTCLEVSSSTISHGEEETDIFLTIPANGACLLVQQLPGADYYPTVKKQSVVRLTLTDFLALQTRVVTLETQMSLVFPNVARNFCVEFDSGGESLYIAYLLGTTEYVYWFKKCMSNELYTFYRVGYRTVTRNYADTDGISSLSGITLLNSTGSDNIGPLGFNDGGLVGGNHLWNNDTELRVKTAKTDSYTIYVNGKQMVAGDKIYTDKVIVKVVNTLYDPAETPTAGQAILTIPASTETVVYEVSENNIFVSVNQHLADNCNNILNRYYGMQSMFGDSDYPESYITPRGQYTDWQAAANASFIKSSYPDFNRFVEKNSNGYQSTYLLPSKYGLHDKLRNNQKIWDYAGSKAYHHLFFVNDFTEATPGLSFTWSGVYTFFAAAILDNSDALIYKGVLNDRPAIFVNAKRAITAPVTIPLQDYTGRAIKEIEKDTAIITGNAFVDAEGVSFTATGTGSFIFVIE